MSENKEVKFWWSYLYTEDELLSSLKRFTNDSTTTWICRFVFLLGNLLLFAAFLDIEPLWRIVLFFTMWTSFLTIEYFFLLAMIYYLGKRASNSLLAIHHMLFSITLVYNIIVVVIYWPLLYKLDLEKPHMQASQYRRWLHRLIHSWPLFTVVGNFYISDITMKPNQGYI